MTAYKRDIKTAMHNYMPRYYEDIRESNAIIDAEAAKFEQFNADAQDVLAQFYVDRATWGLARWERLLGIAVDEDKPISQRREKLKSKMRGVGTVTVEMIKNVAESWYSGEVEVIEKPAQYLVTIRFVSSYGVPANLADVEQAIREIIPAHLDYFFEFKFDTYNNVRTSYANYDEMQASSITYDDLLINEGVGV